MFLCRLQNPTVDLRFDPPRGLGLEGGRGFSVQLQVGRDVDLESVVTQLRGLSQGLLFWLFQGLSKSVQVPLMA